MELESARALKATLLNEVVVPFTRAAAVGLRSRDSRPPSASALATELAAASPLAVSARPIDSLQQVQRSVALGVSRKGKQYQLAIRVQRQALMSSPLVEHLVSQARGEADVRMIGRIEKRQVPTVPAVNPQRARPLAIGTSVGHVAVTQGTLGAFVAAGGKTFILSNNHVLANENRGAAGDGVVQPGTADRGAVPEDVVAHLAKFIPLDGAGANYVDCALAELDAAAAFDPTMIRGLVRGADRTLAGMGPDFLEKGTTVFKLGRTTGATKGRVVAFDVDNLVVSFDIGNLRFDNQVEIESVGNASPFGDGGDSGALVVNEDTLAVGLLFAGGEVGGPKDFGLTYVNPIHRVLADLGVTLVF